MFLISSDPVLLFLLFCERAISTVWLPQISLALVMRNRPHPRPPAYSQTPVPLGPTAIYL